MATDWRKEFFDNFKIYDKSTHQRAAQIIRENMKEHLFTYKSISTEERIKYAIEQIETETLYLAHPLKFNDPFDCSLGISVKDSSSLLTPDLLSLTFGKRFGIKKGDERLNIMSDFLKDDLNKKPKEKAFFDKMLEENIKKNRKVIGESNRVYCFTEKSENIPMWYHYTDNFSGICLQYDTNTFPIDVLNHLFPVCYTDELENMYNKLACFSEKDFKKQNIYGSVPLQKMKDWEYEEEWRVVYNIGELGYSYEDALKLGKEHGVKIPFTKPSCIYLGKEISEENENIFRELGRKHSIPVKKMELSVFGIEFV